VSPDYMTSGWYYAKAGAAAGNEIGPLTWEDLCVLAHGGTLAPTDIVWNPRLPRGVTAGLVPGLFPVPLAPQATTVQPAPQPIVPRPVAATPVVVPPVAASVAAPQPVVPQPATVPQPAIPSQPVAATSRDPLWDVTPASMKATAGPVKAQAQPEIHDLFAEKLEETGGEDLPPDGLKPPKTEKQNRSLPWLIVLLVLVIAAAAVAAYFLYFRDTGGNAGSPATTVADVTTTTAQGNMAPAVWTNLATSGDTPAARSYFAMAYDPTTDRTILFGGSGGDTKFGDTWALDLTSKTWTKIPETGGGPSARDYCQMVYDPVGNDLLLFGGADDSGDRNDLWAFDVTSNTWTRLSPSGTLPPAREGHAMTYEPDKKQVLVFGGLNSDSGTLFNDLWAYDVTANTWTKLDPTGPAPSVRESTAMAYDPGSLQVLIFGGLSLGDNADSELGDMWGFARGTEAMAWGKFLLSGVIPSARQGHALAAAPAFGGLLMFGGRFGDADLNDLWMYDGRWYLQQPLDESPSPREGHQMAYDSSARAVVLFGGFDSGASLDLGDTWVYEAAQSNSVP
jgi:hypothetical protein